MIQPDLKTVFGQVVREFRLKAGMSQEELSFQCGRHRTYVSLIERGKNSPSITTLWLLAAALSVKPSELVRKTELKLTRR